MKDSLLREAKFDNHINSIKPLISELDDPEIENAVSELESLKEVDTLHELKLSFEKTIAVIDYNKSTFFKRIISNWIKVKDKNDPLRVKLAEIEESINDNDWQSIATTIGDLTHPEFKPWLIFIVASDRGLCGNFNSSIVKFSQERVNKSIANGKKVDIVFLGKKAFDVGKNRFDSKSILKIENSKGITLKYVEALLDGIDLSKYDKVKVFYSKFYNTFTQKPMLETIKPWSEDSSLIDNSLADPTTDYGYEYEPQNIEFILKSLVQDYVVIALYSALLESATSENSARMVAMESANRNTKEMLNKLALLYNRSRQAAITTDLIEVIADITKLIKKQNQDAEVTIYETNKTSVSQRLSKIEQISQSKNCTVGIRAIAGKNKAAYISTNDLNNLSDTVSQVVEMAKNAPEDPCINFAVNGSNYISSADLSISDNNVVTVDNLKEIAEAAENSALAHKSITNSEGASSSYALVNTVLSTVSGFIGSFSKSTFANQVSVVAGRESEMKVGYDYDIACNFSDLKLPELMGKEAAKRAVDQLNSRTIKTGKFPVIFEKRAAKGLIKSFASAINGSSIISNSSFLRGSLNAQIFNDRINIIDDPLLPRGIASRPFDGEGITSKKNIFVKNGILQNWILDLYSARKLDSETTGSATRASNAAVIPAASNLYIENGNVSFEELIQEVKEGIYVTDLFGFGVNLINGDYSQGASGFFIENGKITYPIHEITIASNLKDMFSNLFVADDLTFCGQFNSPTIKVSEMTVAGSLND
uniref:Uncharacterized protein n=1 Tax=Glossina austeni TaxID=7395 RepID=A0A1A9VJQ6_GLOAU